MGPIVAALAALQSAPGRASPNQEAQARPYPVSGAGEVFGPPSVQNRG
jgi:hypothetical protein